MDKLSMDKEGMLAVASPDPRTFSMELAGRTLTIETGKFAQQANGAVLVRYGDTVVLVTATMSSAPREGIDFFPLTVDFEERLYSVGRIPGGFIKREGRPTEKATLSARLIDRPIRPLFPDGFRNDVQVVATVMSVEYDNVPELCGMIGASAALTISDIPFDGPIGAVQVGYIDGDFVLNPTSEQTERSLLHLSVAGTRDAVLMVEAGANELPEETILEAIMFGHEQLQKVIDFIESIRDEVGKEKVPVTLYKVPEELDGDVRAFATEKLREAIHQPNKQEREAAIAAVEEETRQHFAETYPEQEKDIDNVLRKILKEEVRKDILEKDARPDGRRGEEIRPIAVEVGILPRTHGSGHFSRGQTQVVSVCTLGPISDVQILDGLSEEESKRYMHHYNFPPYSVGETRPMRSPGRREIGHGALAERALLPMIPPEEDFPYAIRVVSEVLSSNGSTSMASVCGSTLALMDAGVPIKAPVAGIAMGLVKEGDSYAVLSDIQGMEDALGDMDFKVAGTRTGVTAIQMDMKIAGINRELLKVALERAREGRMYIMEKMLAVLPSPRPELSPYSPRVTKLVIDPDKIRDVIGPGGKMINRIISQTGVQIDIEDDGTVYVASTNEAGSREAIAWIERLTKDVQVGEFYTGRVTRIMNFGAFVEILPGKEGMVHISQLAENRVGKVEDVLNIGDEITVKVTEIDNLGRINLSLKEAIREGREVPRTAGGGDQPRAEERSPRPANGGPRRPRRRNRH